MRAVLVTLTMCLCTLPAQAKYSGGTGEPNDPYQIATAADLIVLGESPADYDKHFILTADIDLDPNLPGRKVFDKAVIAPDTDPNDQNDQYEFQGSSFTGVFDGNGHTISRLTINGGSYLGLFGQLRRGQVRNLGVADVNIVGSGIDVGGLVGWNSGGVTQCYSSGKVSGCDAVGGLAGQNSYGDVTDCYNTAVVSGGGNVGGVVGSNWGMVIRCYNSGAVSGASYVGGLVGWNSCGVTHCYSTGPVSGDGDDADFGGVGGLVGRNSGLVTCCYSTGVVSASGRMVGGMVGCDTFERRGNCGFVSGIATGCFWDTQTSGQATSAGGVGLTTVEMRDPYMLGLNGFAEDPNWILDAGSDYPRLAWERTPGNVIPEPAIDWMEGEGTAEVPYVIDTADQITRLGKATVLWDKHLVLRRNVDLDPALPGGRVFERAPIQTFAGVFAGDGHTISHLTIRGGNCLGLFGLLAYRAEVKDLGLVDVNIVGSAPESMCVGGLVGSNQGVATHCYSTGTVNGRSLVGGLAGLNGGSGILTQCYSTSRVSGIWVVGGLLGHNDGGARVTQCYSSGLVTGNEYVGGLVGGGCYSIDIAAEVSLSFWDIQTSDQAESAGGEGLTTAEMQTASAFLEAGWDFVGETDNGTEDIWWINEGKDYPRLWWEAAEE